MPDRAHPAVRRWLAADAVCGCRGHRPRHRALLLAGDHPEQLPAASGPGPGRRLAADHFRPPVPPPRAQAAAPRVHQDRGPQAGTGHPGAVPLAHRHVSGTGRRGRRPRLRAAHPDAGDRRAFWASRPRMGRSSVSSSRPRCRASTCRRRSAPTRMSALFYYLRTQVQDHVSTPAGRPHELPDQRGTRRPQARPSPHCRHHGPAAHRGHRHHVERDRRIPVAPGQDARRTAAGSPPTPGCCRPRSRSSSAPTRRSPWPGWSTRT